MPETDTDRHIARTPPTIPVTTDLDTEIVDIIDLEPGDFVLLPEDCEDSEISLLVDEEYEEPLLVLVAAWNTKGGGECEVELHNPQGETYAEIIPQHGEQIRRVLPGQHHAVWGEIV